MRFRELDLLPTAALLCGLGRHIHAETQTWLDGDALDRIDRPSVRSIIERQNALLVLLVNELELEMGLAHEP